MHTMAANAGFGLPPACNLPIAPSYHPSAAPLPHIEDLLARPNDIDANQSIKRLLELAEASLRQSEMSRDFNRPALALKDFVRASIIAVHLIYSHKDYHSIRIFNTDVARAHNSLLKRISQQSDFYEQLKRDIIADNKRSGVEPMSRLSTFSSSSASSSSPPSTVSASASMTSKMNGHASATSSSPPPYSPPPSSQPFPAHPLPSPPPNGIAGRVKPAVQPKPQALQGNMLPSSHSPASPFNKASLDLAARFANLGGPMTSPGQDPRIKTYPIPPQKPSGPRDMPPTGPVDPTLQTVTSPLPKIPDAIYNPVRGSLSGEAARLPSSTPRGLFTRTGSSASLQSSANASHLQGRPSHASAQTASSPSYESSDALSSLPDGDSITPQQLCHLMKGRSSLLLIDIRSREDFDDGHIMSSSIICIEPSILLRDNISSDEISESMILSPHQEQPLFEKRDSYDLVVFYDQNSDGIPPLPKSSDELLVVSLRRALVHLSYGKELKRPPRILRGGLDAWTDLMGLGALQPTAAPSLNTATANKRRHGMIQRRGSKFVVTTLQPADVKAWQTTLEQDAHQTASRPSFPRTGDDFLRFPVTSAEQESMTSSLVGGPNLRRGPGPRFGPGHAAPLPEPPKRPRAAVQRPSHSGLSERDDDAEPYGDAGLALAQRTSGRLRRGLDPVAGHAVKIYTGLNNPRNWCYANSTLQSLLASPGFGRELADSEWVARYRVPRKKEEKIDPPQLMIRIISNLFHWMSTGKFETMKAQTLMEYSRHLCKSSDPRSQFGGPDQQDAQEFMSFVMDQLHDETNLRRDRSGRVAQPKQTDGRRLVQAAAEYWRNYSELNQSIVDSHWRGLELSTVRCLECQTHSYSFSPFGWVPVSVNQGRDMSLAEALDHHVAGNKLDDFVCNHCKGRRQALQSMSFARMPRLLCINLRRFHYDGRDLKKSNTAISWDFNDFDFSPYVLDPAAAGSRKSGGGDGDDDDDPRRSASDKAFSGPFRYQCYAVIVHAGRQLNTGHYYAYVRDSSAHDPYAWFSCNDSHVSRVRIGSGDAHDLQKDVFRSGTDRVPYLLFFRRKGS